MALDEFLAELDQLAEAAAESFASAGDASELEALRVKLLGAKNGQLKGLQKGLARVATADKPQAGKHFIQTKQHFLHTTTLFMPIFLYKRLKKQPKCYPNLKKKQPL